jgi:hypothetical protein
MEGLIFSSCWGGASDMNRGFFSVSHLKRASSTARIPCTVARELTCSMYRGIFIYVYFISYILYSCNYSLGCNITRTSSSVKSPLGRCWIPILSFVSNILIYISSILGFASYLVTPHPYLSTPHPYLYTPHPYLSTLPHPFLSTSHLQGNTVQKSLPQCGVIFKILRYVLKFCFKILSYCTFTDKVKVLFSHTNFLRIYYRKSVTSVFINVNVDHLVRQHSMSTLKKTIQVKER